MSQKSNIMFIAHAKGVLVDGYLTPSAHAATFSSAPPFKDASTPMTVRFSDSSGLSQIPDNDPNANPRGTAIRFNLGEHLHTDIIAHSTPFFPTRTGAEFLDFLRALAASPPGPPSPSPLEQFLGSHPAGLRFVQAPRPAPESFATEVFFGVNAFKLVNNEGRETFVRFRVVPEAGEKHLDDAVLKKTSDNYLYEELANQIKEQHPTRFKLIAQIASEGDMIDDATIQ